MLLNFLCIIVLHSFLFCVLEVIFALVDFLTVQPGGGGGCIFIPVYQYRNIRKEKELRCTLIRHKEEIRKSKCNLECT